MRLGFMSVMGGGVSRCEKLEVVFGFDVQYTRVQISAQDVL